MRQVSVDRGRGCSCGDSDRPGPHRRSCRHLSPCLASLPARRETSNGFTTRVKPLRTRFGDGKSRRVVCEVSGTGRRGAESTPGRFPPRKDARETASSPCGPPEQSRYRLCSSGEPPGSRCAGARPAIGRAGSNGRLDQREYSTSLQNCARSWPKLIRTIASDARTVKSS